MTKMKFFVEVDVKPGAVLVMTPSHIREALQGVETIRNVSVTIAKPKPHVDQSTSKCTHLTYRENTDNGVFTVYLSTATAIDKQRDCSFIVTYKNRVEHIYVPLVATFEEVECSPQKP